MKFFSWIKNMIVNIGDKSANTQPLGGIFRMFKSSNNWLVGVIGYFCYQILIDVNPELLALIFGAMGVSSVAFKRVENAFTNLGKGISGKVKKE